MTTAPNKPGVGSRAIYLALRADNTIAQLNAQSRGFAAAAVQEIGSDGSNARHVYQPQEPWNQSPMPTKARHAPTKQEAPVEKFNRLKAEWLREMPPSSRMERLILCMPYQHIIGMGRDAIPFLIEEMRTDPRAWFWALEAITEANPVVPDPNGDSESIGRAWIEWAAANGF